MNWFINFRGLLFNEEMVPFWLNTQTLFYLSSHWDQYFLLFIPGYAEEIQLEQVYLQEVVNHLCSLHQQYFQLDIICFLPFLSVKPFSFIRPIHRWGRLWIEMVLMYLGNTVNEISITIGLVAIYPLLKMMSTYA